MPQTLSNPLARRLFLHRHALGEAPAGPASGAALASLIDRLGFVQVDSINTVERAHHMILWSRRPSYRPEALKRLLERDRVLFEHWTHDASVVPMEFLGHWQLRFRRDEARIRARWRDWQGAAFEGKLDEVLERIRLDGPVGTGDVAEERDPGSKGAGWWDWQPSKTALEFLWRIGRLAVTRRDGFAKVYDLAERVYPQVLQHEAEATIAWACASALDRLGFATSGELAAFWGKITPDEAKGWCAAALARGEIEEILLEGADGAPRRSFARPGTVEEAAGLAAAGSRVRVLSPFDPALRDRNRAERLFGFRYRIEVFVPEPQRQYGYYVFPVLEGERLIGRLDARARRSAGVLQVRAFWPEAGVRMGGGRLARLEAELDRLARFAGCERVDFDAGWLRD